VLVRSGSDQGDGPRRRRLAALAIAAVASIALVSCDDAPASGGGTPAATDHPSASGGDGPSPVVDVPTCTRIVGMSQTRQWYRASFETVVPDDRFELFWTGGAAIRSWARPAAWDSGALESPCAAGPPTRVVINVGVGQENLGDVQVYASFIRDAVAIARERFPDAEIGLQPMVAGPGHEACTIVQHGVSSTVNASIAARPVADAIDEVIAEDPTLFRGPDPELGSCAMYRDAIGHLTMTTRDGSVPGDMYAGRVIGEFYAGGES